MVFQQSFSTPFTNHLSNLGSMGDVFGQRQRQSPRQPSAAWMDRSREGAYNWEPSSGMTGDGGESGDLYADFAQLVLTNPAFMPYEGLSPHQNGYNLTQQQYWMMPSGTADHFMSDPSNLWTYWVDQGVDHDYRHLVAPNMGSAWNDYMMRREVDPDFSLSWAQYLSSVDPMAYVSPYQRNQFQLQQQNLAQQQRNMAIQQLQQRGNRRFSGAPRWITY